MPDKPTLADLLQSRHVGNALLPRGHFRRPLDLQAGGLEFREPVWGGAVPQSDEERAWHSPARLGEAVWGALPPVAAFRGGQQLAQSAAERNPWGALGGLGQIAGAVATPFAWPGSAARTLPPVPRPAPGPVTPEAVERWLHEAGAVGVRRRGVPEETAYVDFWNPHVPGQVARDTRLTVRFPHDTHAADLRPDEFGRLIDTGATRWGTPVRTPVTHNTGGQSYANPEALDAALRWQLSAAPQGRNWLVRPDQAPAFVREASGQPPGFRGMVNELRQLTPAERRSRTWSRGPNQPLNERQLRFDFGRRTGPAVIGRPFIGAGLASEVDPAEAF